MGRHPIGDAPMTAAERQRRHRAMQNSDSDFVTEDETAPERSPEREKLAEAIADHTRAIERLERVKEAFGQLDLYGPDREKERAERALADAKERAPRLTVARLLGESCGVLAVVADVAHTATTSSCPLAMLARLA